MDCTRRTKYGRRIKHKHFNCTLTPTAQASGLLSEAAGTKETQIKWLWHAAVPCNAIVFHLGTSERAFVTPGTKALAKNIYTCNSDNTKVTVSFGRGRNGAVCFAVLATKKIRCGESLHNKRTMPSTWLTLYFCDAHSQQEAVHISVCIYVLESAYAGI